MKTVIEVIEEQGLLAHVREMEALIRSTCALGPVEAVQGHGLLLGLRTSSPAARVRDRLLCRDILTGTSADPNIVRLLPPLILQAEHVRRLADALEDWDE
jgi:acetylornithine/succinyldiaminopimelate/putrescine aminotransferase